MSVVDFQIQSAEQVNFFTVRVTFTRPPLATDTAGTHDALNPAQYGITGPSELQVKEAARVNGDPWSVDLILSNTLSVGTWTITLSSNIWAYGETPLEAPHSVLFTVTALSMKEGVHKGTLTETATDVLRSHMPSVFRKKKNWEALLEAIATGDTWNKDNARKAFNQMFISTASGDYLDQRAGEHGVSRPADVGLSDAGIMGDVGFRQYAIRLSNGGLTTESILEVLEVFYGTDAVMAYADAGVSEPYALENGDDLQVTVNGVEVTTTFITEDFASIGAAKAVEVAAALNRSFRLNEVPAFSVPVSDPETGDVHFRIYSGSRGLASRVQVDGGKAQTVFQFAELLATHIPAPLPVWDIVLDPATDRLRFSPNSDFDMSLVQAGDYVTIYGSAFNAANRGTYQIVEVYWAYPGGVLTQWFEVENPDGVNQATVNQATFSGLLAFRPQNNTILTNLSRSVQVASVGDELSIVVPATTAAVDREELTGSYIQAGDGVIVSDATLLRRADGRITIDTVTDHGLDVGNWLYVDGAVPSLTAPAVTAKAAQHSESSLGSIWAAMDAAPNIGMVRAAVAKLGDDAGSALVCGGYDPDKVSGRILPVYSDTAALYGDSPFSIQSGGTYGLGKDASSTIVLRYAPTATSATPHTATLFLPDTTVKQIVLTGSCPTTGAKISPKKVYCKLGDTIQVRVVGATTRYDWVAMYYSWDCPVTPVNGPTALARAGDQWQYMSGTQIAPGGTVANATLTFTPTMEGTFRFVFQANDLFQTLATSPEFTVSNQPLSQLEPLVVDFGSVASGATTDITLTLTNNTGVFVAQDDQSAAFGGNSQIVENGIWQDVPLPEWSCDIQTPGHHVLSARLTGITGTGVVTFRLLQDGEVVDTGTTNRTLLAGGYYQQPTLYFPVYLLAGRRTFRLQWRPETTTNTATFAGVTGNVANLSNRVFTLLPWRALYLSEELATGAAGSESLAVSGVWTDIAAYPVWTDTFDATSYTLVVRLDGIYSSGGKYKFRVVLDGTPLTGDGGDLSATSGAAISTNLVIPVTALSAGSHTFKLQWYRETGATIYLDRSYGGVTYGSRLFMLLDAEMYQQDDAVSSGAGTETIASTSWTDFANCPVWSTVVDEGSYMLAVTPRGFYTSNGANSLGWLRILMNGVEISKFDGGKIGYAPGVYTQPTYWIPVNIPTTGTYDFKIQGKANSGKSIKFDGLSGGFNYGSRVFTLIPSPYPMTLVSTDDNYTVKVLELQEAAEGKFSAYHSVDTRASASLIRCAAGVSVGNASSGTLHKKALVTGGWGNAPLNDCEIYDVGTNSWTGAGALNTARWGHKQITAPDGTVYVFGGSSSYMGLALTSVEVYDPSTDTWSAAPSMLTGRVDCGMVLLDNGKVMLSGGRTLGNSNVVFTEVSECGPVLSTCEVFELGSMIAWAATGPMSWARFGHETIVANGMVFAIGGYGRKPHQPTMDPVAIRDIEVYDQTTGRWRFFARLQYDRPYPIVQLLSNNKILIAGGLSTKTEILDLETGRITLGGADSLYRPLAQGVALDNDLTLMVGGKDAASKLQMRIPASDQYVKGGLNGIFKVVEKVDANTFVVETPDRKSYTLHDNQAEAIVTKFKADD